MRHRVQRHQLGVKKEHRESLMANLAAALFRHGRIETTLAKAKALRPFAEKVITLAKRAAATEDAAKKLHLRRQAIARVRDKDAVKQLFDERAEEFANRQGGYVRIYKIGKRIGDASEMALIELIAADDEGYSKPKKGGKAASRKKADKSAAEAPAAETTAAEAEESPKAEAEDAPKADAPAADAQAEPEAAAEGAPKAEEPKKD